MTLEDWLRTQGGVAHRTLAADAGYDARQVRARAATGRIRILRRAWIATDAAPADLAAAAAAGGRVACVSAARHRGWWLPPLVDPALHLHLPPHGRSGDVPAGTIAHWSVPVAPAGQYALVESVEDALRLWPHVWLPKPPASCGSRPYVRRGCRWTRCGSCDGARPPHPPSHAR